LNELRSMTNEDRARAVIAQERQAVSELLATARAAVEDAAAEQEAVIAAVDAAEPLGVEVPTS
jgi:hypothetical protein